MKKAKNRRIFSEKVVSSRANMNGINNIRKDATTKGRYFIQWDLTTSITCSSFSFP
ncbi:MAG TPA: hypothetical protein P5311_01150 [Candidatus Dojkabacteria bacterium]|nr:hypothetical protein [Candidatus Dojkabacteria bacterium]